jgi:hypothetical protein
MQTPQSFDAQHGGKRFPVNDQLLPTGVLSEVRLQRLS